MTDDGTWYLGVSTGTSFVTEVLTKWTPAANWVAIGIASFTGNGLPDIYGVNQGGQWWVGAFTPGGGFGQSQWLDWLPASGIQTVRTADFNGDSRDDLLIIGNTGQWWVGRSTGGGFEVNPWYNWAAGTRTDTLLLGNLTGNGAAGFWAFNTNGTHSLLQGLSVGNGFATTTLVTDEAPPWTPGEPWAPSSNEVLFNNLPTSLLKRMYFNNNTSYQDYMKYYHGMLHSWLLAAESLGLTDSEIPAYILVQLNAYFDMVAPELAGNYPGLTQEQYRLLMTMNLVQGYYFYTTTNYLGSSLVDLLRLPQGDCSEYAELFRQLAKLQGYDAKHLSWVTNYFSPTANTYVYSEHALVRVDGMVFDPLNNVAMQVDLANIVGVAPTNRLTYLLANHDVFGFYNWNLKPEVRQVYVEENQDPGVLPFYFYYDFEGMGQGYTTLGIY
jgi:hypothetical protein